MALIYLSIFLLFGCLFQTNAFQPAQDCQNRIRLPERCEREKARRGCQNEVMQRNCARTCNLCDKKAPAPPKVAVDCQDTTYGCCWDGKTTKRDYYDAGCPECKDDEIYAALCGIWEKYCHNTTFDKYHEVVQKYCHKTCNNCYVSRTIEQTILVKTLPPAIGHFANSDDTPRRGAIYMWTRRFNPYEYDRFNRQ